MKRPCSFGPWFDSEGNLGSSAKTAGVYVVCAIPAPNVS